MTPNPMSEAESSELEQARIEMRRVLNDGYLEAPTAVIDRLVMSFSRFQKAVDVDLEAARVEAEQMRALVQLARAWAAAEQSETDAEGLEDMVARWNRVQEAQDALRAALTTPDGQGEV